MNPREVCFLIGVDDTVLWSDASSSPIALPDARERWAAVWRLRDRLVEIAHTHPLGGLQFSSEDETTMLALDSALGRQLRYSVITPEGMIVRIPEADGYRDDSVVSRPWWVPLILVASGVEPGPPLRTPYSPATSKES